MNLYYDDLLPEANWEQKADRFCELYATKIRMQSPRAIVERYRMTDVDLVWSMIGQTVAGHAFTMAQLIGPLYLEFLDLFPEKNIPLEILESEALHHDDAEALTGDAATDVDGVTRFMKDAAEAKSIERQYGGMVSLSYMQLRYRSYEARESYPLKLVKMLDAVELVFYAQYCVRNGVGMISRGSEADTFVLKVFDKQVTVDKRTHGEVSEYFATGERAEVPVSEIMYDHSLSRIQSMQRPELTALFKLLCARAFKFPFEKYNLVNLPMDFANLG